MRLSLPDVTLDLAADRGVFAADAVDAGTKVLLTEAIEMPAGGAHLLDLGCGYGPIAVTLARRAPEATVWAVDVNERAVALTAANAAAAGVAARVQARHPDDVPEHVRFAGIWSNPPIRIGKGALRDVLGRWLARLDEGGVAWIVVHKHLGADSLAAWLTANGWPAVRKRSRLGYRVLSITRK